MKSQKSALRRGATVSAVALSALLLASCSAGQITQTASQVAPVDGASAFTENDEVSVHDVTVILDPESGDAALKFTATNQDVRHVDHVLESIEVEGEQITMDQPDPLGYNCTVYGDSAEGLAMAPQADEANACVQYVETEVENQAFAYGGTQEVTFNFDAGTIVVQAAVSAPELPSGEVDRGPETNIPNDVQAELGGEGH